MSDDKNRYVNQCAIDELIEYSFNVQECEDRAAEICETIAQRRKEGIEDKEAEFKLWRNEGIEIHNTYLLYAEFGRQNCVTEHLNEVTLDKLAEDLAEAHKDETNKLMQA
jgi:hypothetical protein